MRTIIVGIGNPILGDDGVGIHVLRELEKGELNEDIVLEEAFTGGMNLVDIIVGYVEASSVAYFNGGKGKGFFPVPFGDDQGTVYGFDIADFNSDGKPDIAAARSGAPNMIYFADSANRK